MGRRIQVSENEKKGGIILMQTDGKEQSFEGCCSYAFPFSAREDSRRSLKISTDSEQICLFAFC
jgi:hypothetical protein